MKSYLPLLAFVLLANTAAADSSVPPRVWGVWTWNHSEPVHVLASPAGNGAPFSEANYFDGTSADATIRVQLWAEGGTIEDPFPPGPVANYPAEDIWLEAPGLTHCGWVNIADDDTDAEGWFTFSRPLATGGCNAIGDEPAILPVMIAGVYLLDEIGGPIAPNVIVNSPDINGDGVVDLRDVVLFSQDFAGAYTVRSDFHWDGQLDLLDVVTLANRQGDHCP